MGGHPLIIGQGKGFCTIILLGEANLAPWLAKVEGFLQIAYC